MWSGVSSMDNSNNLFNGVNHADVRLIPKDSRALHLELFTLSPDF
jgi:hypothetical protein